MYFMHILQFFKAILLKNIIKEDIFDLIIYI
jgi:hypothetical protein